MKVCRKYKIHKCSRGSQSDRTWIFQLGRTWSYSRNTYRDRVPTPSDLPLTAEQAAPIQRIQDPPTTLQLELNLLRHVLCNEEEIGFRIRKIEVELQESKRVRTTEVELTNLAEDPAPLDDIQATRYWDLALASCQHSYLHCVQVVRRRPYSTKYSSTWPHMPRKKLNQRREVRGEPVEYLVKIQIHPTYPAKITRIGALISLQQKNPLRNFWKTIRMASHGPTMKWQA